ncbi:uncharacterized protein LOC62_08G009831 [Vanrija pseudolonga]|uniref:Uncharacterized protein n=1 Tax=Vanrija pseudolonga TaxID=143232 RepID=A0AAF0YGH4_9TREE|nr:hypothetical protein LOC62_08G009831 [Vanrija pseudolonga]
MNHSFADLLNSDPHLPEMIGYIRQLVSGTDGRVVSRNAALAYLGIITAFADRGLLEVGWAPRLLIDIEGKEFEIVLDDEEQLEEPAVVLPPRLEMDLTMAGSFGLPGSSRDHSKQSKLRRFLESLADRDYSGLSVPPLVNRSSVVSVGQLEGEAAASAQVEEGIVGNIVNHLLTLESLDKRWASLTVATNIAYWRLGEAYNAFVESKRGSIPSSRNARTEQKVIFELLCSEPAFQEASKGLKARWSLQKRLQRARKFTLLVGLFGAVVLHAEPEVSVSRIDALKLTDLYLLAQEKSSCAMIQVVVRKLASISIMEV